MDPSDRIRERIEEIFGEVDCGVDCGDENGDSTVVVGLGPVTITMCDGTELRFEDATMTISVNGSGIKLNKNLPSIKPIEGGSGTFKTTTIRSNSFFSIFNIPQDMTNIVEQARKFAEQINCIDLSDLSIIFPNEHEVWARVWKVERRWMLKGELFYGYSNNRCVKCFRSVIKNSRISNPQTQEELVIILIIWEE